MEKDEGLAGYSVTAGIPGLSSWLGMLPGMVSHCKEIGK